MSPSENIKQPRPQSLRARAFSLAEVMLSLGILTMSIFAVVSVNAYSLKASKGNRNRQIANILATSQMAVVESVLKINFHAPAEDIQTVKLASTRFPGFDFIVEDLGYEDSAQNLRAYRTRVFWEEEGVPKQYELQSTLFNY